MWAGKCWRGGGGGRGAKRPEGGGAKGPVAKHLGSETSRGGSGLRAKRLGIKTS